MKGIIKYSAIGLLIICLSLLYVYSQKVWVDNKQVSCVVTENDFGNGIASTFAYQFKCDVTFSIANLTSSKVDASYTVKNVAINNSNVSHSGSVQFGGNASGVVTLEAKEKKKVKVLVGSDFEQTNIKIKAWPID